MCKFFSAIETKKKTLWAFGVDSHENLLELFKIKDETKSPNFVRVEYVPDENGVFKLNVDQDFRPDWFDENKTEKRLAKIILENSITKNIDIIAGSFLCCYANVGKMVGNSFIGVMLDSSQVGTMRESSKVGTMWGSSQVGTMRGSSQVGKMGGSSQVGTMFESSQVGTMFDSSQVGTMRESSQVGKMRESSKVLNKNNGV